MSGEKWSEYFCVRQ